MENNIITNTGLSDDIGFQDNGTERIKGSYPNVLSTAEEILIYLKVKLLPYSNSKLSRISVRFFFLGINAISLASIIDDYLLYTFRLRVEAIIPLETIINIRGVNHQLFWIWIGGNTPERTTDIQLMSQLITKYKRDFTARSNLQKVDNDYTYALISDEAFSKQRSKSLFKGLSQIAPTEKYVQHMASLYQSRFIEYITDNKNTDYIRNVILKNPDTYVYCAINKRTDEIESIVMNEFTVYPISYGIESNTSILICESNDWIKSKFVHQKCIQSLIAHSLRHAIYCRAEVIEVECVPEAFNLAGKVGFNPVEKALMRTSYIITDGKNFELNDSTIPEKFRKFNSLFLGYITPVSETWNYYKHFNE
jgi:hypothetical protein